ncbi:MAG TPA: hypothetical protein VLA75_07550 [Thermoanaerobaculia bacterium]|nr:hypothetical protein [Thermoanaerobaculia bacterium]
MTATRLRTLSLPTLALTLLAATAASAADLVEPWEPGFSSLEIAFGLARGGEAVGATVLGFGLGRGLSAGLTFSGGDTPGEAGLVLAWSRDLGRLGELDLLGFAHAATSEAELDRLDHAVGFEWSAPAGGLQPYVRTTLFWEEGERRVHPLLGLRLAAGRVDLHLELSSAEPAAGEPWPVHLAVGPNFAIAGGFELLPELSLVWNRAAGRLEPAFAIILVTCPRSLFGRSPGGAGEP